MTQGAGAILAAAGSVTDAATQGAGATLGGAGSLTDKATQGVTATLGGAGSLTGAVTQVIAGTTLNGTGSLNANSGGNVSGGGTLGGAGSIGAPDVTQLAPATLAGTGSPDSAESDLGAAATHQRHGIHHHRQGHARSPGRPSSAQVHCPGLAAVQHTTQSATRP